MNYSEFKELVAANLMRYLPDTEGGWRIIESVTNKVNQEMDAISAVKNIKEKGCRATPVFYVQDLYAAYMEGESLEDILQNVARVIQEVKLPGGFQTSDLDLSNWQEEVVMELINRERNAKLLEKAVHQEFLDLAVIYRIIKDEGEYSMSIVVTQELLQRWGISESELHEAARSNTPEKRSYFVSSVSLGRGSDEGSREKADNNVLFLASNVQIDHGATILLFHEFLKKAAELIRGNYYIIPASMHEVYFVAEEPDRIQHLKETIRLANKMVVTKAEYLSDSLYVYDAERDEVRIAA